jgi:hypothetical protein
MQNSRIATRNIPKMRQPWPRVIVQLFLTAAAGSMPLSMTK